jgi:uncharacterized OB-fold protein
MAETAAPAVNTLNMPFWQAAGDGRLVLPFCPATSRYFWPPSPSSPFVTAGAVEWREAEPAGVLKTAVTYRRSFQKAFEDRMPYGIGLVALDCGPRLQVHMAAPEPVPGARVTVGFAVLVPGGPPVPVLLPFQDSINMENEDE